LKQRNTFANRLGRFSNWARPGWPEQVERGANHNFQHPTSDLAMDEIIAIHAETFSRRRRKGRADEHSGHTACAVGQFLNNGLGPRVCGAFARLSKQFSTAIVDKFRLGARPG
jgi:hypothetical protein